jgi:hypothetical protein
VQVVLNGSTDQDKTLLTDLSEWQDRRDKKQKACLLSHRASYHFTLDIVAGRQAMSRRVCVNAPLHLFAANTLTNTFYILPNIVKISQNS